MQGLWAKRKFIFGVATAIGGLYVVTSNFSSYGPILCQIFGNKKEECIQFFEKSGSALYPSFASLLLPQNKFKLGISDYRILLNLAQSKKREIRHAAVIALAEMKKLGDADYMAIAQACDVEIAIGLARIAGVDSKFFLSPPFKDMEKENMQRELHTFLQTLPLPDNNPCLQLYTSRAIYCAQTFIDTCIWYTEVEHQESCHILHYLKEMEAYEETYLQAILEHSCIVEHRDLMIRNGLLMILQKVLFHRQDEVEIESVIAQIIANLSMEKSSAKHMHASGWVGILARWINSPNIKLNLPAAKALANMDEDVESHVFFDNGVYILYPQFRDSDIKMCADIVFIHGILGSAFYTWRQSNSKATHGDKANILQEESNKAVKSMDTIDKNEDHSNNYTFCWPKDWLSDDIPCLRIVAADYNSSISKWKSNCPYETERENLEGKAYDLMKKLVLAGIGERPVIWVSHSMGGLLVKQMLVDAAKSTEPEIRALAEKTSGVVFYSVPHFGSELVDFMQKVMILFLPSIDVRQLVTGSPLLMNLHKTFKELIDKNDIPVLSFGETEKSNLGWHWRSVLVPSSSSDPGFGQYQKLPVDHLGSCKPESRNDIMYHKLLDFIRKSLKNRS